MMRGARGDRRAPTRSRSSRFDARRNEVAVGTGFILLAALLWGMFGPVARVALREGVGPLEIAFWRTIIALALFALHVALWHRKQHLASGEPKRPLGIARHYPEFVVARVDCATATRDFDQVLRHRRAGGLAERALYGRAVCALRERREQAAREDARSYLERFPAGRFAPEARQIASGAVTGPNPR